MRSSRRMLLTADSHNQLPQILLLTLMVIIGVAAVHCQLGTTEQGSSEGGALSGGGRESEESQLEPAQRVDQRRKADSAQTTTATTTTAAAAAATTTTTNQDMIVHEREFVSPQVRVQMECQRDRTIIRVNFTRPFNGVVGAGKLETSKCKLNGNGTSYYEIHVNHNETQCDTQWDNASSSISNTLFIQFHSSLETGSDIAKNLMCRLTVGDLVVGKRPSVRMMQQNTSTSKPKRQTT